LLLLINTRLSTKAVKTDNLGRSVLTHHGLMI